MKKKWIAVCGVAALCAALLVGCGEAVPSGEAVSSTEAVSSLSEAADMAQMVQVNGVLYYGTGEESTITGRCGVMDGEITSAVAEGETPTEDNQSNFGAGYGYQFGATDHTIEVCIDDQWMVFTAIT